MVLSGITLYAMMEPSPNAWGLLLRYSSST
jgi:hypothetical protein